MKKTLLLASDVLPEDLKKLEEYCDIDIRPSSGAREFSEEMMKDFANHEIIAVNTQHATYEIIKYWKEHGLKMLSCSRGTPVNVDWKACKDFDIPLAYTPGRNAQAVAEMVFGLIFGLTRNIVLTNHRIKNKEITGEVNENFLEVPDRKDVIWTYKDGSSSYKGLTLNYEINGRTIGIVGYGAVGRKVAKIARYGFDMEVLAYDPFVSAEDMAKEGVKSVSQEELFKNSDFVSIHLPVLDETIASIDMKLFKLMKPTSFLINSARAIVVNQKDLLDALNNKLIAGYAADVCWIEPLPQNHPFVTMDNVLITPHIGAQVSDIVRHQSELIVSDIIAYCKGEELPHRWKRL